MIDTNIRNRVILFEEELWVVDDIRNDRILMSKLESNSEIEEFDVEVFEAINFDFEQARIQATIVMNQTRYYDNVLSKERDNTIL